MLADAVEVVLAVSELGRGMISKQGAACLGICSLELRRGLSRIVFNARDKFKSALNLSQSTSKRCIFCTSITRSLRRKQTVFTRPLVIPAEMRDNWIKAYALYGYSGVHSGSDFGVNIGYPIGASFRLYPRFREKERFTISRICFDQNCPERLVERMINVDRRPAVDPLIVMVVVHANDIEELISTANLRPEPSSK